MEAIACSISGERRSACGELPQQVVRVAGDAVAAHPGTGEHAEEAVRLGAGGQGDLDRVQAQRAARVGELVGQRQRDGPEDVLVELGGLGGSGELTR